MSEFTLQKTSGRSTTSTVNQSQQNLSLNKKDSISVWTQNKDTTTIPFINGNIDEFKQGDKNDCWLLASIKAISEHPDGAKIIKDAIKQNPNGVVIVELKGVGISYPITKEEILAAKTTGKYATGDDDVLAIELAFEKYRIHIVDSGKATAKNPFSPNYMQYYYPSNPLESGFSKNAIEILTGKKAKRIAPLVDKNLILNDTKIELKKYGEEVLKPYILDKNNVVVAALQTKEDSAHAYYVKGMIDDKVVLIDPYNSSKEVVMPKDEFFSSVKDFTYTNLKEDCDKQLQRTEYFNPTLTKEAQLYKENKNK